MFVNLITSSIIITLVIPVGISPPPEPVEKEENVLTAVIEVVNKPQHLIVSSKAIPEPLDRDSYSATTPEEIQAKKEEEARKAAEEKAKKEAEEAQAEKEKQRRLYVASTGTTNTWAEVTPGDSKCSDKGVCWPIPSFTYNQSINGFRTATRPTHNGFDMLTAQGTPIVAVADGTVRLSSESYGAYGVGVVIDSVIDGKTVTTTYGHMTYGTRAVEAGDKVVAGQMIGRVGSTGRSSANHLHLEVEVNGVKTDPHPWLIENAG